MSSGNGSAAGLTTEELRAVVRAVLRDALPAAAIDALRTTAATSDPGVADVVLRTDADLNAFVARVAVLCEDPGQRAALRAGHRRFRLAASGTAHTGVPPSAPRESAHPVLRVERGAVTERMVKKAAADGARLVVGNHAVLTPLARDKARSLGVVIEKER